MHKLASVVNIEIDRKDKNTEMTDFYLIPIIGRVLIS